MSFSYSVITCFCSISYIPKDITFYTVWWCAYSGGNYTRKKERIEFDQILYMNKILLEIAEAGL